jgi:uncharacterized protein YutE (UPF0331/DUF86 family)
MVADTEIIRDRESRIRGYVRDLRDLARISEEAFLGNRERQYAVLHALQLVIEATVDIATHISAADDLGVPGSYAEAFDLLEKAGIVDGPLADDLRRMARIRNRIVHLYAQVDLPTVYRLLQERLADFDRYLIAIERYLPASRGPEDPPHGA